MTMEKLTKNYVIINHCDDMALFFGEEEIAYIDSSEESIEIIVDWEHSHFDQIARFLIDNVRSLSSVKDIRSFISKGYITLNN